ncbi:MAG: hypothetical protein ABGX27_07730 [Desulfurobacteriaceae bacterium]
MRIALLFLFFVILSFSAYGKDTKEEEMEIFFEATSICSKESPAKCASFIRKNLDKIKSRKLSNRLLLIYAEALFKMGNTLQLKEAIQKISPQELSTVERKKLSVIRNFLLLQQNPQEALDEFLKNWNSYILTIPVEKISAYVEKATKLGKCNVSLKFTSYLLLAYPDLNLTPKSTFQTAMCFYRKGNYTKAFSLFYRIHLLYPTFKPNVVKMYLIHSSLLARKKLKVVSDPENFLYSLTLAPPSKDAFKVYLDFLTKKFKILNRTLFLRGIRTIIAARKYKINLNDYATSLFSLYIPYEYKKHNYKRIVYLFYNLKRQFGLKAKKLSEEGRSYLFASLIEFLAFEEAKKIKESGKIRYSLIPEQTIIYYSFYNLSEIPEKVLNSPKASNTSKLLYLLKVKKNLKNAKKFFFNALKRQEQLNFVPAYLAHFKEKEIVSFYSGIERFEPTKNNYLNFLLYEIALYRTGSFNRIQRLKDLFYNLRTVADDESTEMADYIRYVAKRRGEKLDLQIISRWLSKLKRGISIASR